MSELKVYGFCNIGDFLYRGTDRGQSSNEMLPYYLKSEADKALAEKDAAIAALKEENECLKIELGAANIHCENLINWERRLKRALWLTRAERAASWQIHFALCHNHSIEREFTINGASTPRKGMVTMRTARDWAIIWKKVEWLCKNKAENFKE